MRLNLFQIMSMRTMPEGHDGKYTAMAKSNYAMGLAGESGELVDLMKKEVHHHHNPDVEAIKKECGDVLHYLAGIATMYGLTLEDIAMANIEKLNKRYPTGFSVEDSIKRVDVK